MKFMCEQVARAYLGPPPIQRGAELLWRCPQHDDHDPSLSVNAHKNCWLCGPCGKSGNAWALAAFLAGVEADDKPTVTTSLREHGLVTDAPDAGGSRIAATYDYLDENGKLLFQVVRQEPKDFKQRRPDGQSRWIWDIHGVRRVLYNLPEVIKAEFVLIVEGEKDAQAACQLGFVATCNPGGAGKWRAEYAESLRKPFSRERAHGRT